MLNISSKSKSHILVLIFGPHVPLWLPSIVTLHIYNDVCSPADVKYPRNLKGVLGLSFEEMERELLYLQIVFVQPVQISVAKKNQSLSYLAKLTACIM